MYLQKKNKHQLAVIGTSSRSWVYLIRANCVANSIRLFL